MILDSHAIVIGAGIGGLTLGIALRRVGFRVTILEKAKQLSEVGAGIQLAPNATSVLKRLGVLSAVMEYAHIPEGTVGRRYADDSEIGPRAHGGVGSRFDSPMLAIHRADLQRVLLREALAAGAHLRVDACVQDVDPRFAAQIILTNGDVVSGDVLIGADGINGHTRARMAEFFGVDDRCTTTGDSAYRVTIPRSRLLDQPDVLQILDRGLNTRWMGPHGHIMAYPLRHGSLLNAVLIHADSSAIDDESNIWLRKGRSSDMHDIYATWSPMIRRIIDSIDESTLMEWPLNKRPALPGWCINRTALLGDACHAMLPYVAQGAAQAIEDAGALATCLAYINDIPCALSVYESLRKARAEFIQESAAQMRRVLHMVDGPEQQNRDRLMRAQRGPGWKHPDLWADPAFQDLVWGHDVLAEAEKKCIAIEELQNLVQRGGGDGDVEGGERRATLPSMVVVK